MEKRFLLAFILSFLVLYFWSTLNPQKPIIPQNIVNKELNNTPPSILSITTASPIKILPKEEKIEIIENSYIIAEFSNIGGTLKTVKIKKYHTELPIENFLTDSISYNYDFKVEKISNTEIIYAYFGNDLTIRKQYTLDSKYLITTSIELDSSNLKILNAFSIDMSNLNQSFLKLTHLSNFENQDKIYQNLFDNGYIDRNGLILRKFSEILTPDELKLAEEFSDIRADIYQILLHLYETGKMSDEHAIDKSLFEYVIASENDIYRRNNAYRFTEKDKKTEHVKAQWVGFRDRYFCAIMKPNFSTFGYQLTPYKVINKDEVSTDKQNYLGLHVALIPSTENQLNAKFDAVIYVGPEDLNILKSYEMGFEKIKMFYRFGLFDAISHIIYSFLHIVHKFIPNWGVCIILISTLIYLAMAPMTIKGMASMKRMQALQPKIAELKEKYNNNPQKQQQAMLELYKEYKINPLSGCLPFLLQMPVFIGLYQVFWRDVSFKDSGFLWIKDLSQPDKFLTFPLSLPVIGSHLNLLPIVMVIVMFFQQKMTSKNMVLTDPAQITQQKMMTIMMPLLLGFIFYNFASGLNLYFTVLYALQTFFQWRMSKKI